MAMNRLPIGPISGKQVSKSYSCSEKYEWHNLPFHKSEQAPREQPHHVATIKCPRHISSRMGRYNASHGHGNSPEICGPVNGFDEPGHPSSYNGCQGQDHAYLGHTSAWARRNISPGPGPINSYRRKRSPSFGHVSRYAKRPNRGLCQALSYRKKFSRHYHEDRYLRINDDFPYGPFSEKDAAGHQSYMHSFHAYSKQDSHSSEDPISSISDRTSHVQLRERDEVVRDRRKSPDHEFRAVHEVQLELSPNEDSREFVESHRKFRKPYNGNVVKSKCLKHGSHKSTYNGASPSKYGRNSSQKRNADHLDGNKARINVAYGDKSKRICCPDGQNQQPLVKSDEMRNDIVERNAEMTMLEGPNGAKWQCSPKKNSLTAPASNCSRKCDENSNMLSPKCGSKIIASSNTPNLSEGSKSMDLESDSESSVEGCPKRFMQHLPITRLEKSVQPKGSGNLSYSEVRRDCLDLWRARRLRNNGVSGADKFLEADQQHPAQRGKVSTDGRVRNIRPATVATSKSDEDDITSESSDHFCSATSSERLQKREERSNKKLERDPSCSSIRECEKSHRTTTAEKGLIYGVELQREANTAEVALQNELDKLLYHQLSTDSMSQTHASNTKVHAVPHPDDAVPQNGFPREPDNDNINEKRKDILGVICQNKKERGAEIAEKTVSLCTGLTLLGQNNFASCPKHDILKENASEAPNHGGGTIFGGSELDRGAVTKCLRRPVGSCGSYCRDFKNGLHGTQPQTMNCYISRKEQENSALSDCANQMNQKATKEDLNAPQTLGVGVSSYEQISQHSTLDASNSGPSNRDDRIQYSPIPDLNCLPIMVADEGSDPFEEPICVDEGPVPFEELVCVDEGSVSSVELVCQKATDGSKSQHVTKSLSDTLTGPDIKEEQFKQAEPNQSVGEVCENAEKGTHESAVRMQISESNSGPQLLVCVDEGSVSSVELVCQKATDGSKPQHVIKSLSDTLTGLDIKEEQFKQAEPNQSVEEVCENAEKGTHESAVRMQISESNSGPQQLSNVEGSSTSIDAFKIALCEFIKNILKPLCEDGLLTREVHKIIVKKAVEKVAAVWGSSAPSTETAINRVLSEESPNLYKLVQGYLEVYVGRGVLKKHA